MAFLIVCLIIKFFKQKPIRKRHLTCCSVCGKAFAKTSDLLRHYRVHTGERPYTCARCNRTFPYKTSLKIHMDSHDRQDGVSSVYTCARCPHCTKQVYRLRFSNNTVFSNHHSSQKNHALLVYLFIFVIDYSISSVILMIISTCSRCLFQLSSQNSLRRHMKVHGRPLEHCGACSQVFSVYFWFAF